ncbi:hypothetical protein Tco_1514947 [Tanacetum coccineum]
MGMHRGTRTPMSSRAQESMAKGYQIFLTQISTKNEEDKSEGKQLKDIPIVQDFLECFLDTCRDFHQLDWWKFHINLIPGARAIARAPIDRHRPNEMNLSEQLQSFNKGFP